MRIVVKQSGGLGNQLFQYAAGRMLAERLGGQLRIAVETLRLQSSVGHARPFQLGHYAIEAPFAVRSSFDRLVITDRSDLHAIARLVRRALRIQVIIEQPEDYWFSRAFEVDLRARRIYLRGYWQNHLIATEIEAHLRREFTLKEPPAGENRVIADEIAGSVCPISIHLRRGDYAVVFGDDSMLPTRYYECAVSEMQRRFAAARFFVFTDDVAFAQRWIAARKDFRLVGHNDAFAGHEDLRLMSLCRHHVIANSSFSWWGAWLNPRRDKHVLAPSRWINFDSRERDLLPPEWTVLEV